MSNFAPPEVIKAALASDRPASALYQMMVAKIKVQQPDVTDSALGQLGLHFMAGVSGAFDLFMEASDRPEHEAMQLLSSIHNDIRDFMEVVKQVKPTSH